MSEMINGTWLAWHFSVDHFLIPKPIRKNIRGRNLWMEILQKLVAVALVSIVDSKDALQLSLAITLGMAATCGLVQPYLQPQVGEQQIGGMPVVERWMEFGFVSFRSKSSGVRKMECWLSLFSYCNMFDWFHLYNYLTMDPWQSRIGIFAFLLKLQKMRWTPSSLAVLCLWRWLRWVLVAIGFGWVAPLWRCRCCSVWHKSCNLTVRKAWLCAFGRTW